VLKLAVLVVITVLKQVETKLVFTAYSYILLYRILLHSPPCTVLYYI
jgi:hypothetical protein